MFRYNKNGKLITSAIPLSDSGDIVEMTDAEARFCIGFDEANQPIYDQVAIAENAKRERQKQVDVINSAFDKECSDVGVALNGHSFQYDDVSRSRLLETKDDPRVTFWRSVDNVNVNMNNTKKNELYEILKLTYYTKFAEKSAQIDALG